MKNILIVIMDQLSALALGSYGNHFAKHKYIDQFARESIVFENAYCTTTLCQPSRASFWTSRYPHETKVCTNLRADEMAFDSIGEDIETLGQVFANAGYRCMHFGKEHDYGSLRGFEKIKGEKIIIPREDPALNLSEETFMDLDTTEKVCTWLASDLAKKQPFLMVADLQNPHNICSYIGENEQGTQAFVGNPELPPLPDNFETLDMATRTPYMQYLCCFHRRLRQASHWTDQDYQHYLYAYHSYLDRVDQQFGQILQTLEKKSLAEETLVVLMADHGEGMAAHRMVTKSGSFYEECVRVPFIFRVPGREARRIKGLVSLLDLKPSLQDFAGLPASVKDQGESLRPIIMNQSDKCNKQYLVSEWVDEFIDASVPGRMYRFEDYKYIVYRDFASRESKEVCEFEEFYDLKKDPLEQVNCITDEQYSTQVEQARLGLHTHTENSQDSFYSEKPNYDQAKYRTHLLGYQNHEGQSAVEIFQKTRKKR